MYASAGDFDMSGIGGIERIEPDLKRLLAWAAVGVVAAGAAVATVIWRLA